MTRIAGSWLRNTKECLESASIFKSLKRISLNFASRISETVKGNALTLMTHSHTSKLLESGFQLVRMGNLLKGPSCWRTGRTSLSIDTKLLIKQRCKTMSSLKLAAILCLSCQLTRARKQSSLWNKGTQISLTSLLSLSSRKLEISKFVKQSRSWFW